jgi:hypothetical protein
MRVRGIHTYEEKLCELYDFYEREIARKTILTVVGQVGGTGGI